jgi:hypothetical protein
MPLLLSCPQTPNPSNERTSCSRLRQHKNWKNLKIYFLGSFSFSLTSGWLYYKAAGCRRQRGAADRCFHLATVVVQWSELSAADSRTNLVAVANPIYSIKAPNCHRRLSANSSQATY